MVTPAVLAQQPGLLDPYLVNIARDIAANIHPITKILSDYGITEDEWNRIKADPGFAEYLRQSVIEFQSALNGGQRVTIKSLAMIESALPQFYASMVDQTIPLIQRTDLLKTLGRFAGVGADEKGTGGTGTQFQVRIFLGNDSPLVIEGKPMDSSGGQVIEAR